MGGRNWVCFGFVFWGWVEWNIVVNPCGIRGCVGFDLWGIGFVLHKQGWILDAGYSILDVFPVWRDWVCFE
jgi:hypothetical protein